MAVVMKRPTIDRVPPGEHVPTADERIVMSNISRDTFEAILRSKGEKRRPKVTYLEGTLELMSPSRQHEQIGRTLGDILNAYFAYLGLEFNNYGSWTVSSSDDKATLEPDECYVFGDQSKHRPDLAIEVVWTSGGIEKLDVYRHIGVPEVWFWIDDVITFHILTDAGYRQEERSRCAPGLELARVYPLLELSRGPALLKALRAEFPIP